MSEHNLWGSVRKGLTDAADLKIDLMRVENIVQDGCPDVNFCFAGYEGWIELKHTDSPPARDSTSVFKNGGLRDGQIIWIHRRARVGGNVWILARCGKTIFLVDGRHAKKFNDYTYPELLEFSDWYHIGARVDWKSLLKIIAA